jgi:hypothetical protein
LMNTVKRQKKNTHRPLPIAKLKSHLKVAFFICPLSL